MCQRLWVLVVFAGLTDNVWSESRWVQTGITGRLIYAPDADGDRILDFSNVGYLGQGTAAIPNNVPNVITVFPNAQGDDDTPTIQAAIDHVAALPMGPEGFRGAVMLEAGTYDIHSQLELRASGVVLRGAGSDEGGTVLHGRNVGEPGTNRRALVRVYGTGGWSEVGYRRQMIDKVVPAGSRSFRVNSTNGFEVGDTVRVRRPSKQSWINELGMNRPPNGDEPWKPGDLDLYYDRVITRIEGNRIFLDAPLANSFDLKYGSGTVVKYTWNGAIENIGIESLRGDTDFASPTDEDHAWEFISIGNSRNWSRAQNVWVRNIHASHFGDSAVEVNPGSKWVTVDKVASDHPVSQIIGGRRYSFDLSGELGLVTNSTANEGRHDFASTNGQPSGPNVFHNSAATNAHDDAGPHARWATGTLFDNVTVQGNAINARNRGSYGTTQGWAGANMVIWNSTADSFRVQNPPTAQNWLIGSTGTIVDDTTFGSQPAGYYDSHGTRVTVGGTGSLYDAQVNDAADIREFHWRGGSGNWADHSQWNQHVAPGVYEVSLRDYLVGDIDEFLDDGTSDDAFVDPSWAAQVEDSSELPLANFDSLDGGQNVAITIQTVVDPGERVIHGSLALALRQAHSGFMGTEFVRLFDFDAKHQFHFGSLAWDNQINRSGTFVGIIDLGGSLDELQHGSVNVQVSANTGLDWAIYTATVATPVAGTAGPMIYLDRGGNVTVHANVDPIGGLQLGGTQNSRLILDGHAMLEVTGDFLQLANGHLTIQITGTDVDEMGMMAVGGNALLGGTLEIRLDGVAPQIGDVFTVMDVDGAVVGEFDSLLLPRLSAGLDWWLGYDNAVSLAVVAAGLRGDYNNDGTVDTADFQVWRNYLGTRKWLPNDATPGRVDSADYIVWRANLGQGNAKQSPQYVVVPEPEVRTLLVVTLIVCGLGTSSGTRTRTWSRTKRT